MVTVEFADMWQKRHMSGDQRPHVIATGIGFILSKAIDLDAILQIRLFVKLKLTSCARAGDRAGLFRGGAPQCRSAP
jgi:hypothetical protein